MPATEPAVVPATEPAVIPTIEPAVVPTYRRLTSIEIIEREFAKMTTAVEKALINAKIDVAELIKRLSAITVVRNKKVPLFDEDVFEKIQTIEGLWRKLKNFWTIFDYEVLQCAIDLSECQDAQNILEDFMSQIEPSKIKDADLVLYCKKEQYEGLLKPVLRVKINSDECTPDVENEVKSAVSEAYELIKYKLCLKCIREGCIEMVYCISKSLKLYLVNLAITGSSMAKFLAHDIINLYIDDTDDEYELKVPSNIVDMVSSISN